MPDAPSGRIRILVVDDHRVVRQGLRTFLETQPDLEVAGEAADGAECVAEAERLAPDVILLDLRMPGVDGVEALRMLRERGNPARVLVVTSFTELSAVVPAVRAGAAGYVFKDVDPQALAAAVRAVHAGHVLLQPEIAAALLEGVRDAGVREGGPVPGRGGTLTDREREVLTHIAGGRSNREIARVLVLSEKTVKAHVSAVLAKLGVADRTQAALYAVRHGLDPLTAPRRVARAVVLERATVRRGRRSGVSGMPRDVGALRVPQLGRVVADGSGSWRLVGADGAVVKPVETFMAELLAGGCSAATCRSYCYDLMRWLRFLAAVEVSWQAAGREEVRDFVRWLRASANPARQRASGTDGRPPAGAVNAITGKAYLAAGYAPRTINHALSVLSAFYDYATGAGLALRNPVPKQRGGRPAHRSPLDPSRDPRAAYRQREPARQPRGLDESLLQRLFAVLTGDRDRAMVAVALSSGVRAGELLSMTRGGVDIGMGVLSVVPKGGGGARIWVPVAPEALVLVGRYLASRTPGPLHEPLWLTLRPPDRPLTYMALRQVLERANRQLGTNITWHDLRHTFAHRLLADEDLSLTDVQSLLRHRNLSTVADYAATRLEELVSRLQAHHARSPVPAPTAAVGYDAGELAVLFPSLPLGPS